MRTYRWAFSTILLFALALLASMIELGVTRASQFAAPLTWSSEVGASYSLAQPRLDHLSAPNLSQTTTPTTTPIRQLTYTSKQSGKNDSLPAVTRTTAVKQTRTPNSVCPGCGLAGTTTPPPTPCNGPCPTGTRTPTPTVTPTPRNPPEPCWQYGVTPNTNASLEPPGTLIPGSASDEGMFNIALPFAYKLYDHSFTSVKASANGNLQFSSGDGNWENSCSLPHPEYDDAIFPYWDDLDSRFVNGGGIYTKLSGTVPNRVFTIQWRTCRYYCYITSCSCEEPIQFDVRLYEGQTRFDIVYGQVGPGGNSATIGVQEGSSPRYTLFSCNTSSLSPNSRLDFAYPSVPGGYRILIAYVEPTDYGPPTVLRNQLLAEPGVGVVDLFNAGTSTPSLETLRQYDIVVTWSYNSYADRDTLGNNLADYQDEGGIVIGSDFAFYDYLGIGGRWLSAGYSPYTYGSDYSGVGFTLGSHNPTHPLMRDVTNLDTSYRQNVAPAPGAVQVAAFNPDGSSAVAFKTTNGHSAVGLTAYLGNGSSGGGPTGQWAKVIANAGRWLWLPPPCAPPPTATPIASPTSTVCPIQFTDVPSDHPFYTFIRCLACRKIISGYDDSTFRPGSEITRGQIAKIVSSAAGFGEDPGPQVYEDVLWGSPFYAWINRLSNRGHIGGYPCGLLPEEPCIEPNNYPYYRPSGSATRGQLAKIVANASGNTDPVPTGTQTYTDVDASNPFYLYIERLTARGVMSGYECGGEGEPCDSENRPYFRPYNYVTRGQASKIVANTFFPNCQSP
jgi:hypothetical protein